MSRFDVLVCTHTVDAGEGLLDRAGEDRRHKQQARQATEY
jgi:hypothetical protein